MTNVCLSELDGEEGGLEPLLAGLLGDASTLWSGRGVLGSEKKVEGEDSMLIEMQDAKVLHETGN
jgi:hypothetical protein